MMNPDEAVAIRTYSSAIDARTAASYLESEGIEVYIQEDDAGGAYPQLQMARGVRLLVNPSELKKAEEILKGVEEEEHRKIMPQAQRKQSKKVTILLGGLLLLGLAAWFFLRSSPYVRQGGYTGMEESDQNGDGKPDVWATCKDQNNCFAKVDTDFDGKADATYYDVNGLQQRIDWHPNKSDIIERRELYEHGVKKEEMLDTDRDGQFDIKIAYDPFGRMVSKTKVK